MTTQDRTLYEALQEKFFDSRRLMQQDYARRDNHYQVAQACQSAMDLLEKGKLSDNAKTQIASKLGL